MMWDNGSWGAGDWVAMSLMMLLVWVLLVALVVWLIRSFRNEPTRTDAERPAVARADEVLAERFARGEIDEDEFTHRRELLSSGRS